MSSPLSNYSLSGGASTQTLPGNCVDYVLAKKPTGSITPDTILPASLTGLRGPKGDLGPGNTLSVGNTTTGLPGTNAIASLSGISPNQQLFFTIPSGKSPTLSVNSSVATVPSGTQGSASLNNGVDALHPTLSLTLPSGAAGPANALDVLSTTTGAPGTDADVVVSGTAPSQRLAFTIPSGLKGDKGDKGDTGNTGATGPSNTLSVGGTFTGSAGTNAIASLSGTSPNQTLYFTIPAGVKGDTGNTGATGDTGATGATPTLSVNSTVATISAGNTGSASIGGTLPNNPRLFLTLPAGPQGPQGNPGSDASVTRANITSALGYTPIGDAPDTLHQYARVLGAWQTISGGQTFDQSLNTTDDVQFHSVSINGGYSWLASNGSAYFASGGIILNDIGSASFANGLASVDEIGNITAANLGEMASQTDAPDTLHQYARVKGAWQTITGGQTFDQSLNTTDSVAFRSLVVNDIHGGALNLNQDGSEIVGYQPDAVNNPGVYNWQINGDGSASFNGIFANNPIFANGNFESASGNVLNVGWYDSYLGVGGGGQIGYRYPEGFDFYLTGGGTTFNIQRDTNSFDGQTNITSNNNILFFGGNAAINTDGSTTLSSASIPYSGTYYPVPINIGGYVSDAVTGSGLNAAYADNANNASTASSGWPTALSGFTNDLGFVSTDSLGNLSIGLSTLYANGSASLANGSAWVDSLGVSSLVSVFCNEISCGGPATFDSGISVNNGVYLITGNLNVGGSALYDNGAAYFASGAAGFSSLGAITATNFPPPASLISGLAAVATSGSASDISSGTLNTARLPAALLLSSGTITSSAPAVSLTQTWNAVGTTFEALKSTITNSNSAAESVHFNCVTGASSVFKIHRDGNIWTTSNFVSNGVFQVIPNTAAASGSGGVARLYVSSTNNTVARGSIGIHSGSGGGAFEVAAYSGGANIWEQRNGTSAQINRLYLTFTDASNYSRLSKTAATDRYSIAAEAAGTGSLKPLEFSAYSSASDPTSSLITSGRYGVWKNTTSGVVKLWYNDAGTMKSIAFA